MPRSPEHPRPWEDAIALIPPGIVIDPHAPFFETPPIEVEGIGVVTLTADRMYEYDEDDWGIASVQGRVRIDKARTFHHEGFFDIVLMIQHLALRQSFPALLDISPSLTLATTMQWGEDDADPSPATRYYADDTRWHLPDHPERRFLLFDMPDALPLAHYRLTLPPRSK